MGTGSGHPEVLEAFLRSAVQERTCERIVEHMQTVLQESFRQHPIWGDDPERNDHPYV